MHVNARWLRLPHDGLALGGIGEIVHVACLGVGRTTKRSVLLVNTRLPGIAMHLDLTDDKTVALLNLLTEAGILYRRASAGCGHRGEVRANGTGAAATRQTTDAGGAGPAPGAPRWVTTG
jgi:hypothetical protein